MRIEPLHADLAVQIDEVDLSSPITESQFNNIYNVWLQNPVLRFRNQQLTDPQLQAFSERFGELDPAPVGKLMPGERPEAAVGGRRWPPKRARADRPPRERLSRRP